MNLLTVRVLIITGLILLNIYKIESSKTYWQQRTFLYEIHPSLNFDFNVSIKSGSF